jgi:anthraniloyl-CoA monooxygenase
VRVLTVGGGPAGLYAGLLVKKVRPDAKVTVIERNPRGATYGWGVVFSDRTLAEFREADQPTSEAITDRFVLWDAIDIHYRDELVRSGGHVFAGIARVALLDILRRRCEELGVDVRFEEEMDADVGRVVARHDLVIAADGVNGSLRPAFEKTFRPRLEHGLSRYIWFGTDRVLDSFTFVFRESEHGLFQTHAYPFDGEHGTWIVETDEATWRRAGLDRAGEVESIAYCQRLFAPELRGGRLLSNRSQWISFVTLRNRTWRHNNVVLIGDAAHTAHFSIGSGTKLAMEDAIALARGLERHPDDLTAALTDYELERRPVVERFQEAAAESRTYFENTRRYLHLEPMEFAFGLLTRSGRIDYANLRMRDPRYVDRVDGAFAGGRTVAAPPMVSPLDLRSVRISNRIALEPGPRYKASEGRPSAAQVRDLETAAEEGAGLVVTDIVAVSAEGRITPGCTGLYDGEHAETWASIVDAVHGSGARIGLRLGHAGRRGATRTRDEGADQPLREGSWPVVAPSPDPYLFRGAVPSEMVRPDMDVVVAAFREAAERAAAAGVDLLLVHMAHGYLLGSFLSPLSNTRTDEYGGDRAARMRFPLEVVEAVQAAWPDDRPLGASIQAGDGVGGGWEIEDAVALAAALRESGCDVVEPLVGQTTPESRPRYGRAFLATPADRIRNEARIPVLVGGAITTTAEVNTLLAGGRADLCILSP